MKKTKVLLAGALVLALGLVMGCKQNSDLSVEEHRQGENAYQHVWKAEYTNDQYTRSALQFGKGGVKVQKAKVKVEMVYPANGKAGLLFAVNSRKTGEGESEKTVYDFYAFAFGKKPGQNKLEAYVDYYEGLEKFNGSSDSEKFGTGTNNVTVVDTRDLTYNWDGSQAVNVYMFITRNESKAAGGETTYTYDLEIQDTQGNSLWKESAVTAVGKDGVTGAVVNDGNLYSYGMLSQLASNPKNVNTTWTISNTEGDFIHQGGSMLAADEE